MSGGGMPSGGPGGGALRHGGDHAVIDRVRRAAADHIHHLAVHAQQEKRRVADLEPAHGRELIGRRGRSHGIGGRADRDGGGRGRAGAEGSDDTARPVRVEPDRLHSGVIVVHVVLLRGGDRGHAAVAVDLGRAGGKGQVQRPVRADHIRPAQIGGDHRRVIHLPVGDGIAQRGGVGLSAAGLGRQGVVKEIHAVGPGHLSAPGQGDLVPQAQRRRLAQLRRRERSGQLGGVVAQQAQHRGAGLLQRDGLAGAEGPVGVSGHPPLVHGHLDVPGGPVIAFHVLEKGHALAVAYAVLVLRGADQHFGELRPGDVAAQVQIPGGVAGQDAQRADGLDLAAVRRGHRRPGGDTQQRRRHAHRQQNG